MTTTLYFLDVGQGDCTLIVNNDAQASMLIDCPLRGVPYVEEVLRDHDLSAPTLAVLTHSDLDHMAGLVDLVRRRGAAEVHWNHDRPMPSDRTELPKWRAALRALHGLEDDGVVVGPATEDVTGSLGTVGYELLSPTHGMVAKALAEGRPNYASAIVRIEVGGFVALIGGDADGASWRRLIDGPEDLHADVFRVPHHGGAITFATGDVTWNELLAAVDAELLVVSVGTVNQYGHPLREALEALGRQTPLARIACTEVNAICAGGRRLPREGLGLPSSSLRGAGGKPGACRCAGTVTVTVAPEGWRVSPTPGEHDEVISLLENPMCRPAGTPSATLSHFP
jgi:beta-lactamase superfamily II metal-dependent hydrolase